MADTDKSSSKRSGGGGTSAKKTTTKSTSKSASRKAPTKKTATKKTATKKAAARRAPSAEGNRRPSGSRIAADAVRQLAELTTKEVEGVTALHKSDDGWTVELEVLELRRVPTTTDVLATYEVTLDTSGDLEGYRRVGRYVRGQAEAGG
jgi:hypothetical protein